jgi:hypothetical protein
VAQIPCGKRAKAGVLDMAISLQGFVARPVCSVVLRNQFTGVKSHTVSAYFGFRTLGMAD